MGYISQGSVQDRTARKGGGAGYQWTRKVAQKTVTLSLTAEQFVKMTDATTNYPVVTGGALTASDRPLLDLGVGQIPATGPATATDTLATKGRGLEDTIFRLKDPTNAVVDFKTEPKQFFQKQVGLDPQMHGWAVCVWIRDRNKAGQWQAWYRTAIPLADTRFTEHLTELKDEQP